MSLGRPGEVCACTHKGRTLCLHLTVDFTPSDVFETEHRGHPAEASYCSAQFLLTPHHAAH